MIWHISATNGNIQSCFILYNYEKPERAGHPEVLEPVLRRMARRASCAGSMQRTLTKVPVLGHRGEWAARLIEVINAAQVDVVWVRMTEFTHKKWVDKILHRVMDTFAAFVEAAFDFYTVTCPRALQRMCAWVWRGNVVMQT